MVLIVQEPATSQSLLIHNILINPFVFPFMLNAAGREIPEEISGRKLKPYKGLFSFKPKGKYYAKPLKATKCRRCNSKRLRHKSKERKGGGV